MSYSVDAPFRPQFYELLVDHRDSKQADLGLRSTVTQEIALNGIL
jgi:hypothetical protein